LLLPSPSFVFRQLGHGMPCPANGLGVLSAFVAALTFAVPRSSVATAKHL
jgi:hypothetical protein